MISQPFLAFLRLCIGPTLGGQYRAILGHYLTLSFSTPYVDSLGGGLCRERQRAPTAAISEQGPQGCPRCGGLLTPHVGSLSGGLRRERRRAPLLTPHVGSLGGGLRRERRRAPLLTPHVGG